MPYLILVIGVLIGLFALYRFFLKANVQQIKALSLAAIILVLSIALFFMAITGRLPAALALIVALVPFVISFLKNRANPTKENSTSTENTPLTHEEAFEVLGLKDDSSEDDIQAAYKKLIKKLHPDHEGSQWMAAKLNEARDLLLKD